jgi:hypothetical protein
MNQILAFSVDERNGIKHIGEGTYIDKLRELDG